MEVMKNNYSYINLSKFKFMQTKDFQKKCIEIVNKIDDKYEIKRNPHLSFTQMMEEIGELAKDINYPKLRNKKINKDNLEGEFADVILQLAILADLFDVDFEKAVESKCKILKNRHNL